MKRLLALLIAPLASVLAADPRADPPEVVGEPAEGRETWELHPTYRGANDTIRYAGFSEVIEILGEADPPHLAYLNGSRRCFLAVK